MAKSNILEKEIKNLWNCIGIDKGMLNWYELIRDHLASNYIKLNDCIKTTNPYKS